MKTGIVSFLFIFLSISFAHAQDSTLMNMLDDSLSANAAPAYVTGTFKGIHVVNMHTVEAPAHGVLNFIIMHRFGQLNDGAYNFFGLDNATIRLGLDYGISDRLSVGIGRSSYLKTFDGYAKYKVLRQTDGSNKMPVTTDLLVGLIDYTQKYSDKSYLNTKYRTSYFTQLLIARKFNSNLSLQLVPSWIHYNLVPAKADKNDVFSLGLGGRIKITKRMGIIAEYNFVPDNQIVSTNIHNSLSLGWEIETGGHVFQLVFSNSQAMTEPQYIGQTEGRWAKGDIYFGFNVSRVFNVSKGAKSKALN